MPLGAGSGLCPQSASPRASGSCSLYRAGYRGAHHQFSSPFHRYKNHRRGLPYLPWGNDLHNKGKTLDIESASMEMTQWDAFKMGFLTNALNPKTMLFVVATFTQILHPFSPLHSYIFYGLFISLAHWVWFSFVAVFSLTISCGTRCSGIGACWTAPLAARWWLWVRACWCLRRGC